MRGAKTFIFGAFCLFVLVDGNNDSKVGKKHSKLGKKHTKLGKQHETQPENSPEKLSTKTAKNMAWVCFQRSEADVQRKKKDVQAQSSGSLKLFSLVAHQFKVNLKKKIRGEITNNSDNKGITLITQEIKNQANVIKSKVTAMLDTVSQEMAKKANLIEVLSNSLYFITSIGSETQTYLASLVIVLVGRLYTWGLQKKMVEQGEDVSEKGFGAMDLVKAQAYEVVGEKLKQSENPICSMKGVMKKFDQVKSIVTNLLQVRKTV